MGITACGRPSEEKIEQAQLKYNELVEVHNKTVDAYSQVEDTYLDEDLKQLSDQVNAMKDYNLAEMTEEDIDVIIEEMNGTIKKYETNIVLLAEKKQQEAEALVVEIPLTLHNQTEIEWKELYLFPADGVQGNNVLSDLVSMRREESLTGLYIYKDAEAKPWKIVLSDGGEKVWEFIIPVEELEETGKTFFLQYDPSAESVILAESDAAEGDLESGSEDGSQEGP